MDQSKRFPFTDYCQKRDSQEEYVPLDGTCLRDKTDKTRICACSGLVLHNQWLSSNVHMSNDQILLLTKSVIAKQRPITNITSSINAWEIKAFNVHN